MDGESAATPAGAATALIRTRCGILGGIRIPGNTQTRPVQVFKGVPYAEPPTGLLRWRPPQALKPWNGTRLTLAFGNDCPQPEASPSGVPGQDEDCLYLNIWAPADAVPGSLPVMVWIHGGSFVSGSGAEARCDGTALARAGVVVVTVNYRLGVFGFLAHPGLARESEQGAGGNYGLLDQLCALRWIRDHIADFGGDPNRVTLFGVSAGASCIALWLGAPAAEGLFQQAILQSPGSARPLAAPDLAQHEGLALGRDIDALRRVPPAELLARTALLLSRPRGLTTPRCLRPIRDGWLIVDDEREALEAGRIRPMPLIVGGNVDEGTTLTANWQLTSEQYRQLLTRDFPGAHAHLAREYPAAADNDVRTAVAQLFADTQFNYGVRLIARTMASRGAPTWRYLFSHRREGQQDGPHHTDEVGFVFGNPAIAADGSVLDINAADRRVSASMMAAWVDFAHFGNPNGNSSGNGAMIWPTCAPSGNGYLEWRLPPRIGEGWRTRQLESLGDFFATRTPRD